MQVWRWLISATLLLAAIGCGRPKTPVQEISVQGSGVAIHELGAPLPVWPQWRGPENSGQAIAQGLPVQWSDSENIRWRVDVPGRGHGSPVVTDQFVLLPTAMDDVQEQRVLAFRREDGSLAWNTVVHRQGFPSSRELHQKSTNANGTLACDGQRMFAAFLNSGKIFVTALDLDGKQLWQQEVGAFSSKFGYAPSPILYKSLVIVAADNQGGGYLVALDGREGSIAWRVSRPALSSYSSPMVAQLGGRAQLLISGCNSVNSYDPGSGNVLWATPCLAEATCGTVVVAGDHVFASGGFPQRETACLDSEGVKVWSNKTRAYEPSLVVADDCLFAVTDEGIAYCWSTETGEEHWRQRLGGSFSASPLLSDNRVYASDLSGSTYVFEAWAEGYHEVSVNRLGDDCYASPAAADGCLFLRVGVKANGQRQEQLVCIQATQTD